MRTRNALIAASVLVAVVNVPLMLRAIGPNAWYGFRTSLTRSSPDVWYPVNVFAGWAMFLAAVVSAILLWFFGRRGAEWMRLAFFLAPLTVALIASAIYLRRFG